ncbi:hypothetical protein [Pseudonocardia sp. TRM90224]|uniref:hypothetical protein n=1 Tax=Pseudonocardia sp. TRM90224 TaxID=2812678 RepID=UPI001E296831|nr:hypothetical protein [Pseudonocardia sp. TRM90224]
MSDMAPGDVVASFDSASVLHAGLAAALSGRSFPHLGNSAAAAAAVRAAGRLPWSVLRHLYTRIGASEGIAPHRLGDVDLGAVAGMLADAYPRRRYPAVLVGSTNGALAHLAAAMQVPWLPGTVLVPVARRGDPHRPVDALAFGRAWAPLLLDRNTGVVLHHMHDQVQDELMVARMTYFRMKWRELPAAYTRFLSASLAPGAPVVLIEDTSTWPVVRVGERHVFQPGAQGGLEPERYLARPHTPTADDEAAEAEWGAEPGFGAALATWCAANGHPLLTVRFHGPQAPAHDVASTVRRWYRERGEAADRLVVPSFVLGDPWRTISTAGVPFWTFFSVQAALRALDDHLARSEPYRQVDILQFQHGVRSAGIATPEQWAGVARRHGAQPRLVGLDPRRFPHDIATIARYGPALAEREPARRPWTPMAVTFAMDGVGTPPTGIRSA